VLNITPGNILKMSLFGFVPGPVEWGHYDQKPRIADIDYRDFLFGTEGGSNATNLRRTWTRAVDVNALNQHEVRALQDPDIDTIVANGLAGEFTSKALINELSYETLEHLKSKLRLRTNPSGLTSSQVLLIALRLSENKKGVYTLTPYMKDKIASIADKAAEDTVLTEYVTERNPQVTLKRIRVQYYVLAAYNDIPIKQDIADVMAAMDEEGVLPDKECATFIHKCVLDTDGKVRDWNPQLKKYYDKYILVKSSDVEPKYAKAGFKLAHPALNILKTGYTDEKRRDELRRHYGVNPALTEMHIELRASNQRTENFELYMIDVIPKAGLFDGVKMGDNSLVRLYQPMYATKSDPNKISYYLGRDGDTLYPLEKYKANHVKYGIFGELEDGSGQPIPVFPLGRQLGTGGAIVTSTNAMHYDIAAGVFRCLDAMYRGVVPAAGHGVDFSDMNGWVPFEASKVDDVLDAGRKSTTLAPAGINKTMAAGAYRPDDDENMDSDGDDY
jgi:hypothetical protein